MQIPKKLELIKYAIFEDSNENLKRRIQILEDINQHHCYFMAHKGMAMTNWC